MAKATESQSLETLITPVTKAEGCELYDIEYVKEGGDRILRLYIDKEGGVDLDDCERVSRAVEKVLDKHDPIPTAYRLQVGSPGIERKLAKPEHFKKYEGHKITLRLFAPYSPPNGTHETVAATGRKKFTGQLKSFNENTIILKDEDNNEWTFDIKQVSACRLVVF